MKRIAIFGPVVGALALVGALTASADHSQRSLGGTRAVPVPTLPPRGDFVRVVDNAYFPLRPGTTFRYQGTQDGQPREVTVFVTHQTKTILGVRTIVVRDEVTVGGQPEERTFDWYAQDDDGNVWYFGEDSFDYVNGTWVRSDGSWEGGVDGARPGIVMEGDPSVGDTYRQEYYAGHAEDMAKVLSTDASVSVPYGSFDHALVTKEWTPLEHAVVENKYYARGVGNVRTVMVRGGSEEENLVSVTTGG
jgi:hypothetical protein